MTNSTVSLEPAAWQVVIENLRRGALQYEAATGMKAEGTIALMRQIQDQLKPNTRIDGQEEPLLDKSDGSLPDWSDRITFRSGADEEIILRVPRQDEEGNWSDINVLTMRHARELAEALINNERKKV